MNTVPKNRPAAQRGHRRPVAHTARRQPGAHRIASGAHQVPDHCPRSVLRRVATDIVARIRSGELTDLEQVKAAVNAAMGAP